MEIGEKIRRARLKKGMSQAELGEKLGVQRSAVSKWEKGQVVNIKRSTLLKLSKYLDISPNELVECDYSDTENVSEQKQESQEKPTVDYRIVSEDEFGAIWENVLEMSSILNADRKKRLMEYALVLLKDQREEIDKMLEAAKTFKK